MLDSFSDIQEAKPLPLGELECLRAQQFNVETMAAATWRIHQALHDVSTAEAAA